MNTSAGSFGSASLAIVDVTTENDVTGTAYGTVYSREALLPLAALIKSLEPRLAGRTLDPPALSADLRHAFRLDGRTGLIGSAIAAIDMALWDALARSADLPLARLLGAAPGTRIGTYAALRGWRPRELADEAAEAAAGGFRAVKAKIGHSTLGGDLAVVDAIRSAAGDAVAVMVDYNQALDLDEALSRCRALAGRGVAWIEEPIRYDDRAGNARLATETGATIQLGENHWTAGAVDDAINAGGSKTIMMDAMRIGGVTGWLEAAAIARRTRVPVSSHAFDEFSSHLLAATPNAHLLEWTGRVAPLLIAGAPTLVDGWAVPVETAGSGIAWDEEMVCRHAVVP